MTEAYYEYKKADLMLRICNADAASKYYKSVNQFVRANEWRKLSEKLEKRYKELLHEVEGTGTVGAD